MSSTPIAEHALLSDCHTAALVSREGSVEWLCFPDFDSASVFARLLDDAAGHWSIRPVGDFRVDRRYLDQTMVLETTFTTATGSATLVDALAMGANERGHDLGGGAPSLLIRQLEGVSGRVELEIEYVPCTEYGLVHPLLRQVDGGVSGRGGADVTMLSTTVELELGTGMAAGRVAISEGERLAFGLHHRRLGEELPQVWSPSELTRRLADTVAAWRSWSGLHQSYDGPWHDLVHQSGRVLQALTFYPTGAVVAAATTSLPEAAGGNRNWDYRYSWVRDASLTMDALWVAACPDEAEKFFTYLSTAAATSLGRGSDLQIMFGIRGEHDLTERELSHLAGWRGSAPVRVGNGAWTQRQVDVYGELLAAVYRLRDQIGEPDPTTRDFLVKVADAGRDAGPTRTRESGRYAAPSRTSCTPRSCAGSPWTGPSPWPGCSTPRTEWTPGARRGTRSTRPFSARAGARRPGPSRSTSARTTSTLPTSCCRSWASCPHATPGYSPPSTPSRIGSPTSGASSTATTPKEESTDWRVPRARSCSAPSGWPRRWPSRTNPSAPGLSLARAASYVNDLGLLAEEVDERGELLGNFPQAFSHIGLVNAAWAISEAESRLA